MSKKKVVEPFEIHVCTLHNCDIFSGILYAHIFKIKKLIHTRPNILILFSSVYKILEFDLRWVTAE